jgi:hypothetical protein
MGGGMEEATSPDNLLVCIGTVIAAFLGDTNGGNEVDRVVRGEVAPDAREVRGERTGGECVEVRGSTSNVVDSLVGLFSLLFVGLF